jgi:hypothetical protein
VLVKVFAEDYCVFGVYILIVVDVRVRVVDSSWIEGFA